MRHRYVQFTSSYPRRSKKHWNGKLATRFLAHWSEGRVSHGEPDTLIYSVENVYSIPTMCQSLCYIGPRPLGVLNSGK